MFFPSHTFAESNKGVISFDEMIRYKVLTIVLEVATDVCSRIS